MTKEWSTIEEAMDWLRSLLIAEHRVEWVREEAARVGKMIGGDLESGAGSIEHYDGHAANEAEGTEDCPEFDFAWLRFNFQGGIAHPIHLKITHGGDTVA